MTQFNLTKQSEKVQFVLAKRNLTDMRASVGLTIDVSGSIEPLFNNGSIQRVLEQIIPIGLKFDDNGNLDVYTFSDSNSIAQVEGATTDNYQGFVRDQIVNNDDVPKWGGTSYAPVIDKMLHDYGFYGEGSSYNKSLASGDKTKATPSTKPKKGLWSKLFGSNNSESDEAHPPKIGQLRHESASGEAVINYFITDGVNDDASATHYLLDKVEKAKSNIYFMFIGVGEEDKFSFIQSLGERYNNVGFLNVHDLAKFTDSDDIYEQLLPDELCNWLKQKQIK